MSLLRTLASRNGVQLCQKTFRTQILRHFRGVSYVQLKTLRKSVTPALYETVRILASVQNALYSTKVNGNCNGNGNGRKFEISYEELLDRLDDGGIHLIDVREPKELEKLGKIPQATNIPLTKLKCALSKSPEEFENLYNFPKPAKTAENIVFYGLCDIKGCTAVELAYKLGFKKVRHYPGGFDEWSQKHKATG